MYAIVKTGGKQYMVEQGNKILVEKLNVAEGDTVSLEVVALSDNEDVKTGDAAASAKVTAKVLSHGKGKKLIVFKYKPKKDYRKKKGHRQPYTQLEIASIQV